MGMYYDPGSGQWYPTSSVPLGGIPGFQMGAFQQGAFQMAAQRLSVTIDQNGADDGQTQHAELVQAAEMLARVAAAMVGSMATSGNVTDRNGVTTGHWTYTPTAPS